MQADRDEEFPHNQEFRKEYYFDDDIKKITFGNINSNQKINSKYASNASNNISYQAYKNDKNKNPSN